MSGNYRPKALLSGLLLLTASSLGAQKEWQDPAIPVLEKRPVARAVLVEMAPLLDGEVLDDPAWAKALPVSGFTQTVPDEGQPASQKTEIRIVYTQDTLFLGVICYDSEPDTIVITESRRDASLLETDSIQIILDTYRDRQNGFVFGTNPLGIEYDAQVTDEGGGSGSFRMGNNASTQGGSGGGVNVNWDGSWEVKSKISEIGWSTEFAIPFRTLRYPAGKSQTWGLNFQRNIRRRAENSYWASLPRQHSLYRLSLAGNLEGLEIPSQRNLKVMPYALGEIRRRGTVSGQTNWLGEFGADVKIGLTPSLNLDLTYNTDFAQVEVDEQQVNLDRFNLFFPEKRPFFLENAGLFSVGASEEVDLFFSRRIGIAPNGQPTPILGGARLTGKISGTDIGFLNMQTEEREGVTPGNNYLVGRIRRELPNRSYLGTLFTNRQGTGRLAPEKDHSQTFAMDGRWGIGESAEVIGFLAGTSTPGLEGRQHAFQIGPRYNTKSWRMSTDFTEVGEDFNPEIGFLARTAYRKLNVSVFNFSRPPDFLGLLELRPHVSYRAFWDFDGFQESSRWHIDNHWEWRNGYEVHTGVNLSKEGLPDPFEISPKVTVPTGTYEHAEFQLVAFTNQSSPVSYRLDGRFGGFFGGDRISLTHNIKLRLGQIFNADLEWNRNDIDLPGGDFVTNLGRLRVSYAFSPRIFAQGLLQYNDRADQWSTNLRFGWLQASNTGLFVVYDDTRAIGDRLFSEPDRSLFIKLSWLFDVLG